MPCIIPGCPNDAEHNLSVRLRRPDTSAIWAPNTEAYLCDAHATQGLRITVVLEPTSAHEIETRVCAISETTPQRKTRITKEA